ncbi:MAG: fumarylacetoacetate hydrolase family protein [Candidatus Bathyarchaeota archaeon]|nr:MAG: fumarylacetoacetate hydrolase family protein [Candidatus Bathyarchaeota archaeon]
MRFVRYLHLGVESFGLRVGDEVTDLQTLASGILETSFPSTMEELIGLGEEGTRTVELLVRDSTRIEKRNAALKIVNTPLLAPVSSPPKIICLGLNYRDHAEEIGTDLPDEPIIFMKPRTAIVGPDEPIIQPKFVKELDYEAELAIIIGKKGKNIPVLEAKKYVFGYTAFNDVSAREIQFKDRQWTRGKSFDTFAPIGPCITTPDQIGDVGNLRIRTRVNRGLRQDSSTKNMVFNVHEVVHHISRVMTLEPCDVIATGTPAGVAVFMKPTPKFLLPGDLVEVEIENIGTLRNKVARGA